jgi:hypothetical protein
MRVLKEYKEDMIWDKRKRRGRSDEYLNPGKIHHRLPRFHQVFVPGGARKELQRDFKNVASIC